MHLGAAHAGLPGEDGMALRLWDFACSCGKTYRDWPITAKKVPQTIACECGKRASWISRRQNAIHESHSGMKYGEFDPQFGCVVESYGHKRQLMRERGMVEVGGPEKIDDIREDIAAQEAVAASRGPRDPNILQADSIPELMESIESNPELDRKHTGKLRGREGQDENGLFDSWAHF